MLAEHDEQHAFNRPHQESPYGGVSQRERNRVLVVEDNEINQKVMAAMLKNMQLITEMAYNGLEALSAMSTRPFDLIFMDCQMPVMDGYQCTEAIREREGKERSARIPIIAITANAQPENRERCITCGMDDYMAKPVQMQHLRQLLETYLPKTPRAGENGYER